VTATASTPDTPPGWARLLPGVDRLRHYQRPWLRGDVLAGVTVAAYLVPQCMAYGELAGLPPIVGLWAILAPLALYAVLGSSRQLSIGPESTTAIMTAVAIAPLAAGDPSTYAALAAALAIVVGLICIAGFGLKMGFLADLLSKPILVGYMAGVALIMISGQLDKVTGAEAGGDHFFEEVASFLGHLDGIDWSTLVLSTSVLVFLFVVQHFFPRIPGPLLAVLLSTAVVAGFDLVDNGIEVVGAIPPGLPAPQVPDVSWGQLTSLLGPAVGIAIVGYTDNVLTARAFANRNGYDIDANQELLALGTANVGTGFLQGFPISSSGSRTALGDNLGSKTQLSMLVALAGVVGVILFLGPLLENFPSAALGAIVIYAATKLIDVPEFIRLRRFRRSELVLALATLVGVLAVDILYGVLIAVGLSAADLFRRVARPHDAVQGQVPGLAGMHDIDDYPDASTIPGLMIYRYDAPLFFANAEDFRIRAVRSLDEETAPVEWFVVNTEAIVEIDITAADVLVELHEELTGRGIRMGLVRVKQDLRTELDRAGIIALVGDDMVFPTLPTAVAAFEHRVAEP
jgi:sulfate permease, SulP family